MGIRWLLVAPLLFAGSVRADNDRSAALSKKLIGAWQLVKGSVAGTPFPEEMVKKIRLDLTDGKYKLTGAESPDQGTWSLHTDKKPLGIDVTGTEGPNKGKTFLAIFELHGDNLKVCYDLSGKSRPAKFESSKKSLLFLAEYRRARQ